MSNESFVLRNSVSSWKRRWTAAGNLFIWNSMTTPLFIYPRAREFSPQPFRSERLPCNSGRIRNDQVESFAPHRREHVAFPKLSVVDPVQPRIESREPDCPRIAVHAHHAIA